MSQFAPERIDGPPPLERPYGLLKAAQAPAAPVRLLTDQDARGVERWLDGVSVFPWPTHRGATDAGGGGGTEAEEKEWGNEDDLDRDIPQFAPFTAYVADTCPTWKVPNQEEYRARITAQLIAVESGIVAHEFLTGSRVATNPHLADGNGDFPAGDTPLSIENGLAELEAAIARTRKQGIIHISPQMALAAHDRLDFDSRSGVIRTINGTVVIPDAGYTDGATPPAHAAPGPTAEWAFATGPLDIRRTEVVMLPEDVREALDRGNPGSATVGMPNRLTYRAERYYLIDWDGDLQTAVLIDRCQTACTG